MDEKVCGVIGRSDHVVRRNCNAPGIATRNNSIAEEVL
jgi:hypothetical protein